MIIDGYQKACEFALSELPFISLLQHSSSDTNPTDTNKKEKGEERSESKQQLENEIIPQEEQEIIQQDEEKNLQKQEKEISQAEREIINEPSDELLQYLANTALHSKGIS